jgi:hypothetical protein
MQRNKDFVKKWIESIKVSEEEKTLIQKEKIEYGAK